MPNNFTPLRTLIAPLSLTAADPVWWSLARNIGPEVTLTGVDTDGVHSFNVADVTVSHTRLGAETSAAVVDAWAVAATALIGTTLKGIIQRADSDGAGKLYLTPVHDDGTQAQQFVLDTFVAPGAAVITTAPLGEFPITAVMPRSAANGIEVWIRMLDSNDNPVPDGPGPLGAFIDLEVLANDTDRRFTGRLQQSPSHRIAEPLRCPVPPGVKFTVRAASIVDAPLGSPALALLDHIAVDWSPVVL